MIPAYLQRSWYTGRSSAGQELRLPGQPTLSTAPVAEGAASPPAVRPALPTRLTGDLNEMGRVPVQLEGATHVLNGAKP